MENKFKHCGACGMLKECDAAKACLLQREEQKQKLDDYVNARQHFKEEYEEQTDLPNETHHKLMDEAVTRCEQWINQNTFNRFSIHTYLYHMAKFGYFVGCEDQKEMQKLINSQTDSIYALIKERNQLKKEIEGLINTFKKP